MKVKKTGENVREWALLQEDELVESGVNEISKDKYEWTLLIKKAKNMGLTKESIRSFLKGS